MYLQHKTSAEVYLALLLLCTGLGSAAKIKQKEKNPQVSLNDLFGALGGAMTTFVPAKEREALKQGLDVLTTELDTLSKPGKGWKEEWEVVQVEKKGDVFVVPHGFQTVEVNAANFFRFLQYLRTSIESGNIKFMRKIGDSSGSVGGSKEASAEFDPLTPLTGGTTNVINNTYYDITLSFPWPRGVDSLTHLTVTLPDGAKENVYVWAAPKKEQFTQGYIYVYILFKETRYLGSVGLNEGGNGKRTDKVVLKIEDNKIVKINNNLNGLLKYSNYFEDGWRRELLYIMNYMASLGIKQTEGGVDYREVWTPEIVSQMTNLVNLEIILWLDSISLNGDNFTPEQMMAGIPLLDKTKSGGISNVKLSKSQWAEMAKVGGIERFRLTDLTIPRDSSDSIAKMISRQKSTSLQRIIIEDINSFMDSFEKYVAVDKVPCYSLQLWDIDEGAIEEYKVKIKQFAKKHCWTVTQDYNDGVMIQNQNRNKSKC